MSARTLFNNGYVVLFYVDVLLSIFLKIDK